MIHIKKYKELQLRSMGYYPMDSIIKQPLSFIYLLFSNGFYRIRRDGVKNFITKHKEGMGFEEVDIDIDNTDNIVYFSEGHYGHDNKPTTSEVDNLFEEENFIELCKLGFLDHITMTKDNFTHILFAWDKILDQQSPFALLYQDDKDWFDVKPFDTQEAMEQFVADQTQK